MKRLALVAAVLAVAACGKKEEAPAADTSMMTPAPAASMADSSAKMADTAMKMVDTAKKMVDSAMKKVDSAMKKKM